MLEAAHEVLRGGARGKLAAGVSLPAVRARPRDRARGPRPGPDAARADVDLDYGAAQGSPARGCSTASRSSSCPGSRRRLVGDPAAPARALADRRGPRLRRRGDRGRRATARPSPRPPPGGCSSGSIAGCATPAWPLRCSSTRRSRGSRRSRARCSPAPACSSRPRPTCPPPPRRCAPRCTSTATTRSSARPASPRTATCSRRPTTASSGCSTRSRPRTPGSSRDPRRARGVRALRARPARGSRRACSNGCATTARRAPGLRGAALGALWVLDVADDDELVAGPVQFADPGHLGDFLYGLFTLAREPVQRRPDLITRIDDVVMAFADGEFLDALPALRRAFSVFTPREKDRLARSLPGGAGLEPRAGRRARDAAGDARARDAPARGARPATGCGREPGAPAPAGGSCWGRRPRARSALRWSRGPRRATARSAGSTSARRGEERNVRQGGSLGDSELTIPDWINDVHELFPRRVVERLEKDALERYGMLEIATDRERPRARDAEPDALEGDPGDQAPHERRGARGGAADHPRGRRGAAREARAAGRIRRSPAHWTVAGPRRHRVASNFDAQATIRRNLRHYDPAVAAGSSSPSRCSPRACAATSTAGR